MLQELSGREAFATARMPPMMLQPRSGRSGFTTAPAPLAMSGTAVASSQQSKPAASSSPAASAAANPPWALPPFHSPQKVFTIRPARTYLHNPPAFLASQLQPALEQRHQPQQAASEFVDREELRCLVLSAEVLLREKDGVTASYLELIEERVDAFLAAMSFDPRAVPYDYLDSPPAAPDAVLSNFHLLTHLATEVFNPHSAVQRELIQPTTQHVWDTALHPLRRDLSRTADDLAKAAASLQLQQRHQGADNNESDAALAASVAKLLAGIRRDIAYLDTIERQEPQWIADAHADVNSHAPADVVPVSGLIVSRLHRLENEHRTVIEHWRLA